MNKIIMLVTKDKRKFLTDHKNLKCLTEFAKNFKAQIFLVKVEKGKVIINLKRLAAAICSSSSENYPIKCAKLKKLYPISKK